MRTALAVLIAFTGCVTDAEDNLGVEDFGEWSGDVQSNNRIAFNKLASINRPAAQRLATAKLATSIVTQPSSLLETADGREFLTYLVSCALPAGTQVSVALPSKPTYTFNGEIGLAAAWATRAPTVSERRWVSACILARTNYYGQTVSISMRGWHTALATTPAELLAYSMDEAGYYGDLFLATPQMLVCRSHLNFNSAAASAGLRKCSEVVGTGTTTQCGFTLTGYCHSGPLCTTKTIPYATCRVNPASGSSTIPEVITVMLKPN